MASSSDNDNLRKTLVLQAKLADKAERYDDMAAAMKKLAQLNITLSSEERNLLTQSFKKSIRNRRYSWITLSSSIANNNIFTNSFIQKIESEITNICNDVVALVDDHLIPTSSSSSNYDEDKVFYLKMKGDYYRYLAEIHVGLEREKLAEMSLTAYEAAVATAEAELAVTNPVRLGVGLNMSVLYYQVLEWMEKGLEVAERAYDEALPELINIDRNDPCYQDTVAILRLLGDNLTLWKSTMHEEQGQR